jgi:hypothetical protein
MTINMSVRQPALSVVASDSRRDPRRAILTVIAPATDARGNPPASNEPSGLRFALDRAIHRLTGWHLIEPCNCARCQLRRVSIE